PDFGWHSAATRGAQKPAAAGNAVCTGCIDERGGILKYQRHPYRKPSSAQALEKGQRKRGYGKNRNPFSYLARQEGFEPPTAWFVARYSIQLSYWRVGVCILRIRVSESISYCTFLTQSAYSIGTVCRLRTCSGPTG